MNDSSRHPLVKLFMLLMVLLSLMAVTTFSQQRFNEDNDEDEQEEVQFTNEWLVRVKNRSHALRVAKENGYIIKKEVRNFPNTFVFARLGHHRSRRESRDLTELLVSDPRVDWAEQSCIRTRVKRAGRGGLASHLFVPDPRGRGAIPIPYMSSQRFNDELWNYQWYVRRTINRPTLPLVDLKIEDAWDLGYSGKGIVITVVDDGIEYNHTDLQQNYDPKASFDANDNDNDPFPRYDAYNTNAHGTKCAGEIAMSSNNGKCGVGVAFNAKIGGIRCLDGPVVDEVEAAALAFNNQYIDIYSASWGPPDDGKTVDGPKRLAQEALKNGVTRGRRGRGVIYVWASGNGGVSGDNCNCDGYVSSIYTLSVGAATQHGRFPWYGERCAAMLAVAYSSGTYTDQKVATTDLHNKCTLDHTGTSAAAPLAAGIIALVLEANNKLTWRDVQHLVVWTSDYEPLIENKGWKRNSAGLLFNSRFGFGLLNAVALVKAAANWTHVPPMTECQTKTGMRLPIQISSGGSTFAIFQTDGCHGTHQEVNSLEQVQLFVDIDHENRGTLEIYLKSPSGTVSMLLSPRPNDRSKNGFANWYFTSVHFWGEHPRGRWSLLIREKSSSSSKNETKKSSQRAGSIQAAKIIFYGSRSIPSHLKKKKVYEDEKMASSILDRVEEYEEDDLYEQNAHNNDLRVVPDSGPLLNWNDYGFALVPVINDQQPQLTGRIRDRLSYNVSWP